MVLLVSERDRMSEATNLVITPEIDWNGEEAPLAQFPQPGAPPPVESKHWPLVPAAV